MYVPPLYCCTSCLVEHVYHRTDCISAGCDFLRLFWSVAAGDSLCQWRTCSLIVLNLFSCKSRRRAERVFCMSFNVSYCFRCEIVSKISNHVQEDIDLSLVLVCCHKSFDWILYYIFNHVAENGIRILTIGNKIMRPCCWNSSLTLGRQSQWQD